MERRKGRGGSLERRISGTRVAAEAAAAAARQGEDPTQTARPRKIEMFGCLNVGVLSQHSSFHPSFPFLSLLAPLLLFESVPISRDTTALPGGRSRFQTRSRDMEEDPRRDPRSSNDSRNNEVTAPEWFTHHLHRRRRCRRRPSLPPRGVKTNIYRECGNLRWVRASEPGKASPLLLAYLIIRLLDSHPLFARHGRSGSGRRSSGLAGAIDQRLSVGYGRQISGTQDIKRAEHPSLDTNARAHVSAWPR